jgi:MmgE/PrpD N-terminal domain/Amidohydrolase
LCPVKFISFYFSKTQVHFGAQPLLFWSVIDVANFDEQRKVIFRAEKGALILATENFNGPEVIAALSRNVLKTRFEDLDPAVVDYTKRRILDMIGCGIGGSNAPGNAVLAELVRQWGGRGDAALLGFGYKAPVDIVAMANCIFGRSFDWGPLVIIMDNAPALDLAHKFFGPEHLLFGTDMPYDNAHGDRDIRETIRGVEEMNITDGERKKIYEDNARSLLRLPV